MHWVLKFSYSRNISDFCIYCVHLLLKSSRTVTIFRLVYISHIWKITKTTAKISLTKYNKKGTYDKKIYGKISVSQQVSKWKVLTTKRRTEICPFIWPNFSVVKMCQDEISSGETLRWNITWQNVQLPKPRDRLGRVRLVPITIR